MSPADWRVRRDRDDSFVARVNAGLFLSTPTCSSIGSTHRSKHARATEWIGHLWRSREGRVSPQILHETYDNATRKLGVDSTDARRFVRALEAWDPIPMNAQIRARAWTIEDRWGFNWWDALVVASAQQAGCAYLLSEDLQDRQNLDGLEVVNPFLRTPTQIAP